MMPPESCIHPMSPISELSTKTMWRATTATGETQVFHLKLIAEDWAGPGGRVQAEPEQQKRHAPDTCSAANAGSPWA